MAPRPHACQSSAELPPQCLILDFASLGVIFLRLGGNGLPLALVWMLGQGVNQKRHGPLAQDFLALPAWESSLLWGHHPVLPDVNSASNEWLSSSVWEDMLSVIKPVDCLSHPGTSCLGKSEGTNKKGVGRGRGLGRIQWMGLHGVRGYPRTDTFMSGPLRYASRNPTHSSRLCPRFRASKQLWVIETLLGSSSWPWCHRRCLISRVVLTNELRQGLWAQRMHFLSPCKLKQLKTVPGSEVRDTSCSCRRTDSNSQDYSVAPNSPYLQF